MYRPGARQWRAVGSGRAAMAALLAATGSVVFIEPAPYDLIAIAMAVWCFSTGLRFPRGIALPMLLLALYLVGNALAALTAADPALTVRSLAIRTYMVLTWVLVVSLIVDSPRRVVTALWSGYLVAAVIAVAWGTLEYLGFLPGEAWAGGMRAKGAFKDPNVCGPFLVPAALYAIHRMVERAHARRLLFGALFLLFAFGILLSFSRGAWVNLTVALMVFWLLLLKAPARLERKLNRVTGGVAMAAVVCVVILAAVSHETIGNRFFERAVVVQDYDLGSHAGSPIGRFGAQRNAIERIGRDPLGIGPGMSFHELGLEPHNIYLHVTVEAGWLGGLSFLLLLLYTARRLPELRAGGEFFDGQRRLLVACLAGVLVQSLFIDSTHWRHLWLLLGVSWGLIIAATQMRTRHL